MALELGKRDHEQRAMDRKGLIRIGTERYRISKKQVPQYGLKQKMLWADIWNIALGLGFGFWGVDRVLRIWGCGTNVKSAELLLKGSLRLVY